MTGRLDPTALVIGLLFVALGVGFLLDSLDVWELRAAVVISLLVIGLGVAVVAGQLARADRRG